MKLHFPYNNYPITIAELVWTFGCYQHIDDTKYPSPCRGGLEPIRLLQAIQDMEKFEDWPSIKEEFKLK